MDEQEQTGQESQGYNDDEIEDLSQQYWNYIENLNRETLVCAKRTFSFSYWVNWILVVLGVGLFLLSFYDIVRNGVVLENTVLGALGVGSVVTIFLVSPQNKIAEAIGDFLQVQMYHRTYEALFRFVTDWKYINDEYLNIEDLEYVVDILIGNTLRLTSSIGVALGETVMKFGEVKSISLTVDPVEVSRGEIINVDVEVNNEGSVAANKKIEVKLDESTDVVVSKKITLEGNTSTTIPFEITTDSLAAGTHTVKVDDLRTHFKIIEPEPSEPEPTEPTEPEPSEPEPTEPTEPEPSEPEPTEPNKI